MYLLKYHLLIYLATKTMILSGSRAIVNTNIARGGPKAMKPQPKNSIIVMIGSNLKKINFFLSLTRLAD